MKTHLNILVVDDEQDMIDYIVDVVEDMNFEVLSLTDPTLFSSTFSPEIDILILDLFMPTIDGIELLRLIPNTNRHVAVIFMSGKNNDVLHSAEKLAIEQGIFVLNTLQKPFSPEQLEQVLHHYIPPENTQVKHKQENNLPTIAELELAIQNKELFMYYQPQINLANKRVVGVEALIRWRHPKKGFISPALFILLAEEEGPENLIAEITTFSAQAAIKQAGLWKKQGVSLRMSINMSPKVINDLNMPEKLSQYAIEANVDNADIMIEVTETAAISHLASYIDILTRIRMKGFGLSIDDFGTGYSSLQQLVQIPYTELKVDRSFVSNINNDTDNKIITEISILLAHKLGLHVVAEGIENETTWNILHDINCDEGQGYWMAKPMSAHKILAWKQQWDLLSHVANRCRKTNVEELM
ncbi:MAG: EAL domain-containing response regulator [Colwellia sp.]